MLSATTTKRRRKKRRPLLPWYLRRKVLLLLFSGALLAFGFLFGKGKVVQVVDGDTVVVLTDKGDLKRVRLYGIDAPESKQRGGEEATLFARELMLFKSVSLSEVNTDIYGRSVSLIRLENGQTANAEMIRAGHAWLYRDYCKEAFCASWAVYESQARSQRKGLWTEKNPTAPWKWRKQRR